MPACSGPGARGSAPRAPRALRAGAAAADPAPLHAACPGKCASARCKPAHSHCPGAPSAPIAAPGNRAIHCDPDRSTGCRRPSWTHCPVHASRRLPAWARPELGQGRKPPYSCRSPTRPSRRRPAAPSAQASPCWVRHRGSTRPPRDQATGRRYRSQASGVGVVPAPGSRGRRNSPASTRAGSVNACWIHGMYSSSAQAGWAQAR